MGILASIGIGKPRTTATNTAGAPARPSAGVNAGMTASRGISNGAPARAPSMGKPAGTAPSRSKRGKRGGVPSARERVASAAAPLHERRRRLVAARESTLRDLGGLMLEMYKRNRFREELLLDKCEEVLAIEVEVAHVDQRLFQLAPPNAAGMRPIGRCDCGAPIHPGQNFCGVCGRSFSTLTQSRACLKCGAGLRAGDLFCGTCGHEAPDMLQSIESPGRTADEGGQHIDGSAAAASAVAETLIIDAPPLDVPPPTPAGPAATFVPDETASLMSDETASLLPDETPSNFPDPVEASGSRSDSAPAPAIHPRGFDWSAPPANADAAIDTAVEVAAAEPAPFTGFPLTATIPAPPKIGGDDDLFAHPPDTRMTAPGASPSATSATEASADDASPVSPAERKAAAKLEAARKRERIKAAKARAKAARSQRKRGDGL